MTAPATATQTARKNHRPWLNGWTMGAVAITALVSMPIFAVIFIALTPGDNIWGHLASTVLPLYIGTTLLLMTGVGLGTTVIGVGTAWLVSMCRFPGKALFEWALLLPMAMPAYIIAYIYTDIFEYAGPVQALLRETFGFATKRDYWFPEIRSLGGAVSMMTLVLYPYVYLLSRAAFMEQSVCVLEASRVLGRGPYRSFFSVAIPLARPAIIIGVSLVLMEVLNDFGTVDFFAVSTFTLGIYDVWLNMNNVSGAAQLAVTLLLFVVALVLAERFARRNKKYHSTTAKYTALPGYPLVGIRGFLATAACAAPVLLGFVLPAAVLGGYSFIYFETAVNSDFLGYAFNSLMLSSLAAGLAVGIGIFMAYGLRLHGGRVLKAMVRLASLGYAVPGSVLAIGVLVSLGTIDNGIDGFMRTNFGVSTGLMLSGTIAALTFGYLVRFLAISFGSIEASLGKITPGMDGASRSLGRGPLGTLRHVHLPLIRASVLTAAMMIFVDGMKELPLTVILRPFNFHTLATFVHEYASDEQLGEASPAALSIVAFGILPVIILSLAITRARPGYAKGRAG